MSGIEGLTAAMSNRRSSKAFHYCVFLYNTRTTCLHFDKLKSAIFDAVIFSACLSCSLLRIGRFPRVNWHHGEKLISRFLIPSHVFFLHETDFLLCPCCSIGTKFTYGITVWEWSKKTVVITLVSMRMLSSVAFKANFGLLKCKWVVQSAAFKKIVT